MDPTKNFDHLDPKLKETYARVMGTAAGDPAQNPAGQPAANAAAPTPAQNSMPNAMNQPQNQFSAAAQNPAFQNQNAGPNPGTGPTVSSIPTGTTTMVPPVQAASAPDMNASANSPFFSNPSPATTNPAQSPVPTDANNNLSTPFTPVTEQAPAPVTPYSPDNASQYVPTIETTQALPSPSSVAQAPKQTSALLRVLYIVAAVIFFAIYTVFWIKVFNLPFLF